MGYLHIENLYRPAAQIILLFKELYALEKIHGTSAHVAWRQGMVWYSSGGESAVNFRALFDDAALTAAFQQLGHDEVTVYGEAYGGKCQGMHKTYGDKLRFIAFDVKIGPGEGGAWLSVPNMTDVAIRLGFEVVPWRKVPSNLAALDAERDLPSEVAVRRGITEPRTREGVVLRPLHEFTMNNGNRVIAKHKGETFSETKSPRHVVDPVALPMLTGAQAIADEWVTPRRLEHVLQRVENSDDIAAMSRVISAMIEDVFREAEGEIVESKEAKAAIGRATAKLFKQSLAKVS